MSSVLQVTRLLAFHLQRAVEIHDHVVVVATESHWLHETLNHLTTGVVLLSRTYEPIYANKAADEILKTALSPVEGATAATGYSDRYAMLETVIAKAAAKMLPCNQLSLSIGRPHGRRALGLVVRSLPRRQGTAEADEAALAVFINDPESTSPALLGVLRDVYGLTPRETEFTSMLAQGFDLEHIAASSGITKKTARSRLKASLPKREHTGNRR